MSEKTVVAVFPSLFSLNKIGFLRSSIIRILKQKKQDFNSVEKDDSVLIVEAKDPVFASSIIGSLFGIEKIAIATQVENSFDLAVSTIAKVGTNLLLKGERFYVKVDGKATSYLPKDVELAATSLLIEKTANLETKPGSEQNHDKLLYTYLTNSNAYICIFVDKGLGGVPQKSQNQNILCCVYDELSVVTCLQCIKVGFGVKIIVCYRNEADLLNIVKMINPVLPLAGENKIELQFCKLQISSSGSSNFLLKIAVITEILIVIARLKKIGMASLAISPLIFPVWFVEYNLMRIFQKGLVPWFPLSGLEDDIFQTAKELGLEKHLNKIETVCRLKYPSNRISLDKINSIAKMALKTRKSITVTIGPKNIHDILDSLKSNH